MENHFLPYRNSNIHYKRMGNGPEWLFCFHGYGELGSSFQVFEELLGKSHTLIAMDFPYHGETDWQEGLLFDIPDLINIIHLIKPIEKQFNLMGYSMGGRVALQLLQTIPAKIKSLVLVAPDGLHKNKWQWLSTKTFLGKQLFAYTMKNPNWIMRFLPAASQLGIFNKSLLKFVHYYLDDAAQREILYRRWITMRKFSPNKTLLIECIRKYSTPTNLVFGKYDRIITSKHGWAFRRKATSLITVTELEAGHLLLKEKHAHLIASLMLG